MIYEYFKTLRKYVPPTTTHHTYPKTPLVLGHVPVVQLPHDAVLSVAERNRAAHLNITLEEYKRRDILVRKSALETMFQTGDTAYPIRREDYEKYGACMINFVGRKYLDLGPLDAWPKHDNPMIITFTPLKDKNKRINCTPNYLSKTNIHLEIPLC